MHREIQIKQFPIVTTHWWPKTRNERFVWENEQYLYRFLPLVHNHVQVIWVRARIRCVTCVRSLWLSLWKRRKSRARSKAEASISAGCVHALTQITWAWLCTRGKNDINTVRFLTQTARFMCLRPSMCSYDGNCLIWISLCMFFFPLIETVTYTCHYMTDRLERFDLKISKLDLLKKKKTPTSWMPLG